MSVLEIDNKVQYVGSALPNTGNSSGSGSTPPSPPSPPPTKTLELTLESPIAEGLHERTLANKTIDIKVKVKEFHKTKYPMRKLKEFDIGNNTTREIPVIKNQKEYIISKDTKKLTTIKFEGKTSLHTDTKELSFKFVDAMYWGVNQEFPNETQIKSYTKIISDSKEIEVEYNTNNSNCVFCYPKELGELRSILGGGLLEYKNTFEKTIVNITTPANEIVSYYVYKSDRATLTSFKYKFIFD